MLSYMASGVEEDYSQPILPGEGPSDYERYLRTDELLALQKTPEEMSHRDARVTRRSRSQRRSDTRGARP